MTNLNALIAEVGTVSRTPGEARGAVLHVLHRVDEGWLTPTEARQVLETLGLIPETSSQIAQTRLRGPEPRRRPR